MRYSQLRKLVEQVVAGGGSSAGIVVGPWEAVDHTGWPFDNQSIAIAGVDVPSEFEISMLSNPGETDVSFRIQNAVTNEIYGSSPTDANNVRYVKTFIPAGVDLTVTRFGNDAQGASVSFFRRRTLA